MHGPVLAIGLLAMVVGSAYVSVPLPLGPVPMTMQSLAVLMAGIWGGPRLGAAVCASYLALGLAGAPVFANGEVAPGFALFARPSAGYLLAFVPAAFLAGWLYLRVGTRSVPSAIAALLAGHAVILAGGLAYLSGLMPVAKAVAVGVLPFVPGTLVKVALGCALTVASRAHLKGAKR